MRECQDSKKDPLQLLTFLAYLRALKQASVIAETSILSTSTCRNYFGRPEHWNSQISPGEKPSHPVSTRKTKNKALQHSWKNTATRKSSQATTR